MKISKSIDQKSIDDIQTSIDKELNKNILGERSEFIHKKILRLCNKLIELKYRNGINRTLFT